MLKKSKLTEKEKHAALEHKILIGVALRLLAEHFGGETTINQMRIGHYVGLKSLYEKQPTNNTDISRSLKIPRSTVSRIVTDCIEKGWLIERPDPNDGRKKMLVVPMDHPQADAFEIDFRAAITEFLKRYDAGDIIKIDSDGNGF